MQTAATPAPSSTNLSDWAVGDEFRADGNRPMRITAIIPVELVAEFIEGPVCGVWERRAAVTAARTASRARGSRADRNLDVQILGHED